MRRAPLLSTALLILGVSTAHAGQGVNMRWSACFGDGGADNRSFACDTNSGSNVLVGSFELSTPIPQVTGQRMGVDLSSTTVALPSWWMFRNAGTCRQSSLSVSFLPPPSAVNCVDWASGQALGGIGAYLVGLRGPSTARIFMTQAVSNDLASDLEPATEYVSFSLTINNAKTVGASACGGCAVPVCLAFSYVELVQAGTTVLYPITGAAHGTNSFFTTWQGPVPVPPGGLECPWPVPVRQETWGAVKSLYR